MHSEFFHLVNDLPRLRGVLRSVDGRKLVFAIGRLRRITRLMEKYGVAIENGTWKFGRYGGRGSPPYADFEMHVLERRFGRNEYVQMQNRIRLDEADGAVLVSTLIFFRLTASGTSEFNYNIRMFSDLRLQAVVHDGDDYRKNERLATLLEASVKKSSDLRYMIRDRAACGPLQHRRITVREETQFMEAAIKLFRGR